MPTKVLVVGDGPVTTQRRGINFLLSKQFARPNSPKRYVQDMTDWTFTVSTFIDLLRDSAAGITVTTAHREECPGADIPQFVFDQVNLTQWDVLWLFGYDGYNEGDDVGSPIKASEVAAIEAFMSAGGGVFATGDHEGMGSFMCGAIPRVKTMRLWWYNNDKGYVPAGYPTTAVNCSGVIVASCSWPATNYDAEKATWPPNSRFQLPFFRMDTIAKGSDADFAQANPRSSDKTVYDFSWQSDGVPQQLTPIIGTYNGTKQPHPILVGPHGTLTRFPDHMHEGEVVTPHEPDVNEYPTKASPSQGNQPARPLPHMIATGQMTGGHTTVVTNTGPGCYVFTEDDDATVHRGPMGALCVYDGSPIGLGRIVTDSSFHHYLDLNISGDPCSTYADARQGFGADPAPGSILHDLQTFYVNTVLWLADGHQ